jgi:outer membrane protein OmpA-like peptidoglycan-associated protein
VRAHLAALGALFLCGCATQSVLLLPDEDPHPEQGKVAVLETRGKPQSDVIDKANSRTRLGARPASRVLSEARLPKRDLLLVSQLPPKPLEVTLYYDEGSSRIDPSSRPDLDRLLAEVNKRKGVEVQISGYTDRKGADDDNDALSQKRADAILAQLVEAGVPAADMVAVGRGERDPVVVTEDGVEEPRNRRVVVTVR